MASWRAPPVDEGLAAGLARALGLRGLTARVLLGRGLAEADGATRFLSPRLADLRLPEGMADLEVAADRLESALLRGERMGVFGDYDVDGVTSAAVLTLALRALGGEVVARVADRAAGYGFSPAEANRFADEGCRVVLTADCGTSDHEALTRSRERGVDAIVIDHHQVPAGASPAFALINPHRTDDRFGFKGLASCGVAFYLAAALRTRLRARQHGPALEFDPRRLLDLVALGTLADLVPLQQENRILVSAGLRELGGWRRPGLRALRAIAELDPDRPVDANTVCFRLTPRLNAPGRLGQAQRALDLLLSQDDQEAARQALEIDEINRQRQKVQEEVWLAARAEAETQPDASAIVVGAEGWHPGVVGIVAAKLVERFRRPAVVIGFRDGVGRGSARTSHGFNLHLALEACGQHLVVHGGHAAAAGLTIKIEKLAAFREAFVAEARLHLTSQASPPDALVDAAADLGEIDLVQAEELGRLAPFGNANQEVVLALAGMVVRTCRPVGQGHLQMSLGRGGSAAEAIGFGMAAEAPAEGSVVDVLATPEVDAFRGFRRVRLRLKRIFPGGY